MLLPIVKLPLIIIYLVALALLKATSDKKQRATYLMCAITVGVLIAL